MRRPVRIGCIVEGHGDAEALPIIVRRIAGEVVPESVVIAQAIIRRPKSLLVRPDHLRREVSVAAQRLLANGDRVGLLIVVDSDNDCPAQLGPRMLRDAQAGRADIPIGVVVAHREFEAWYLAGLDSLVGLLGVPARSQRPKNPEAIRGAKERLSKLMHPSQYDELKYQAAFARHLDLQQARTAPSFDKCYREVSRLLAEMTR